MSHTPVETLVPEGTSADLTRVASQVLQGRKLNVVASIESARSLWDVDGIASRNEDDSLNVLVSVHNVRFSPIYQFAAEDYMYAFECLVQIASPCY